MILAVDRNDVADYVGTLFSVYSLLIIAYIVMQLIFTFVRPSGYSRVVDAIFGFLRDVSEPLLRPFRRILPMLGPFDLSPIVALLVLSIVGRIVVGIIDEP